MRQIYAFETRVEYEKYQGIIERFTEKIGEYQNELEKNYTLNHIPKAIIWTSEEVATTVFSNVPIPAFTNKNVIYFTPDLSNWKSLFIKQLEGKKNTRIENYYKNLSENHLLTIVGHELTHHSELFVDEFDDERTDSIWFEEGMCDYLARKFFLNVTEFNELSNIELELVEIFNSKYGNRSLEDFGSASYKGSLTSIMFDYWRSFLTIKFLVEEKANHDVKRVFSEYHRWHDDGRKEPLVKYFEVENLFN